MNTQENTKQWRFDRLSAGHCPGIDPDGRNWQIYVVTNDNQSVARVHGASMEECEELGCLVKSAPALLDALKGLHALVGSLAHELHIHPSLLPQIEEAHQAILAAEGRE